jgi:hydroxymethylpyrimidine/phosphomethylpyrimidine kinase
VTTLQTVPIALTIAGSDSGGGAGIQADLKAFTAVGVYGLCVITAVTAQNSRGVHRVQEVGADMVDAQLGAVLDDVAPMATKIGMLPGAGVVEVVAHRVAYHRLRAVIVDPVVRSTTGAVLADDDAFASARSRLFPMALLVTPNLDEAERLTGREVRSPSAMEDAARAIHDMGPSNVLVKGGHLDGDRLVDILFDGQVFSHLAGDRIANRNRHGTGCVLSAAIAANLARGHDLSAAVSRAHALTRRAIRYGLELGRGPGPCDPTALTE